VHESKQNKINQRDPSVSPREHLDTGRSFEKDETEEYYQILFKYAPLPAYIFDLETLQFLQVNKAATGFYGYSEEEFLSMYLKDIRPREDIPILEEFLKRIAENKPPLHHTWKHLKKNGEIVEVEIKGNDFNYQGKKTRLVMIYDVTDVRKAERDLEKLNEQYRLANERFQFVTNVASEIIWDWDIRNEKIEWSENFQRIFGHSLPDDSKLAFSYCIDNLHPDDKEIVIQSLTEVMNDPAKKRWECELRYKGNEGGYTFLEVKSYIVRDDDEKAIRMIGAAKDITERKRIEQQLLSQQKEISQATISSQEKERTEISKELHDNVNQVLTTTKLYLDLAVAKPELKDDLIKKSSENLASAINEVRRLSQSLMSLSLEDLGLVDSIDDLLETFHSTKKLSPVFIHYGFDENDLNENQKLILFRILEEALMNISKHSEATSVRIELLERDKKIQLIIEDNGKGFDSFAIKKGEGLNNIRNRVYLVSGNLTIETHPGKGCKLVVQLPLDPIH